MQQRGKHTSVRIEELLGNGVLCWANPRLYNEDPRLAENRIEAVSLRWQWKMMEKRRQCVI
jgi:hypothetical protein